METLEKSVLLLPFFLHGNYFHQSSSISVPLFLSFAGITTVGALKANGSFKCSGKDCRGQRCWVPERLYIDIITCDPQVYFMGGKGQKNCHRASLRLLKPGVKTSGRKVNSEIWVLLRIWTHSLNNYLLSTCHMPDQGGDWNEARTVPGAQNGRSPLCCTLVPTPCQAPRVQQ